jgi:hypothetical protein
MAQLSGHAAAKAGGHATDRRIVLGLAGIVLLGVVVVSLLGPSHEDNDPAPTTYNAGSHGAKAAYLLLSELGYDARRWSLPLDELNGVDPSKTTLILAQPILPVKNLKPVRAAIASFLSRGGRVVATGATGASLLPDGSTSDPTHVYDKLCFTVPEGAGALARAGKVSMADPARWSANGPEYRVEQRCGNDAVVVRYGYGSGEAIWWSSSMPLTNAGLKEDASLKLLLASLGPSGRVVLFDEYFHEQRDSFLDTLKGLPWLPLGWQCAAVGVLLVLSRGRRNGPLRLPVRVPRSSPLEFAESMGRLYSVAGATEAATDAARGRLLRFLAEQCGLSREELRSNPDAIAEALAERFGGDWTGLSAHLEQAREARSNPVAATSAIKLVQALEADRREIQARISDGKRKWQRVQNQLGEDVRQ